jgi:hypothetical protein
MVGEKYKGYVIARKLIENENLKPKPFTYYPSVKGGKPPYLFSSKTKAKKFMQSRKWKNNMLSGESNLVLVKYKPRMYLDRY